MRLRFTLEALTHIDAIHFYINDRSPAAAQRIAAPSPLTQQYFCASCPDCKPKMADCATAAMPRAA
jgi:hypothetical protein